MCTTYMKPIHFIDRTEDIGVYSSNKKKAPILRSGLLGWDRSFYSNSCESKTSPLRPAKVILFLLIYSVTVASATTGA